MTYSVRSSEAMKVEVRVRLCEAHKHTRFLRVKFSIQELFALENTEEFCDEPLCENGQSYLLVTLLDAANMKHLVEEKAVTP